MFAPKAASPAKSGKLRVMIPAAAKTETVKSAFVGARFPPELLARIDAYAEARQIGRSKALREILEKGLS